MGSALLSRSDLTTRMEPRRQALMSGVCPVERDWLLMLAPARSNSSSSSWSSSELLRHRHALSNGTSPVAVGNSIRRACSGERLARARLTASMVSRTLLSERCSVRLEDRVSPPLTLRRRSPITPPPLRVRG